MPKSLPNYFIASLAAVLPKGTARSEVFISSLTTFDGQQVDITAFAQENSTGTLIVDPQGQSTVEYIGFTNIDSVGIGFTGCTGGLSSLGDGASIPANLRFHPVGATVIIGFSSYDLKNFMDLYTAQTLGTMAIKTFSAFPLFPSSNPTTALQGAHKQYVDEVLSGTAGTASNTQNGTLKIDQNANALPRALNVYVQQQTSPGMTLKVLPFHANINEFVVAYAGGNTGTITAPVSNPRIDLIVITSGSALAIRTGSENISPSVPTPTTGDIVLAEIFNRVGETSVKDNDDSTNGYIQRWLTPALYRTNLVTSFPYFSDGSDGSVTFDGTTTILGLVPSGNVYTLTRDLLLDTATVNSGVTIKLNGWKLYGKTAIINNGIIHNDGGSGGNGTNGVDSGGATTGGTAGSATAAGSVNASIAGVVGGAGGANGTNNGANGNGGNAATSAYLTAGALAAGNGGIGSSGAASGGTGGGVGTTTSTFKSTLKDIFQAFTALLTVNSQAGNGAGGGGAGGATDGTAASSGGSGGGSGANGGSAFVAAFALTISATGIIRSNGGNGGNGGNGQRRSGGGGGGNGGNGGLVITVAHILINSGTIQASGGSLGTGGTKGASDGTAGTNGQVGANGTIISIIV